MARHVVEQVNDDELVFTLSSNGWRRRVAIVCAMCDDEPWVMITAPVARAVMSHLEHALRMVSRSAVGALVLEDTRVYVRHAEPLAHMSFERVENLTRAVALGAVELDHLARRSSRSASGAFQHFAE